MTQLLSNETIIAILATTAAWIAALFAYKSYDVSMRALKLSEDENKSRKSNITAYLSDSYKIYNKKEKLLKYAFSIMYSNKSEATDFITEVTLEVFYVNSSKRLSSIISHHDEDGKSWLSEKAKPAILPINLPSRSSKTNWFLFSVPNVAEDAVKISKYKVTAKNSNGSSAIVESSILREVEVEETN